MRGFDGEAFEPRVGELVVIRRFGLGDDGAVLPVSSSADPWLDGRNTARCVRGEAHDAPDPDCVCGFYAYNDPAWLTRGFLTGVISCWGRVIVGSRGVRAEFARIDALAIPDHVNELLVRRIRAHYPSVGLYPDEASMLAAHPLSGGPAEARRVPARWITGLRAGLLTALLGVPLVVWVAPWALDGSLAAWVERLFLVALVVRRDRRPPHAPRFAVAGCLTGRCRSADRRVLSLVASLVLAHPRRRVAAPHPARLSVCQAVDQAEATTSCRDL